MSRRNKVITQALTFADVQAVIANIPNIDQGGCGIAALAMARWIHKNEPTKKTCLFVMGQDSKYAFSLNMQAVMDPTNNDSEAASHVGLIVYDRSKGTQHIVDSSRIFDMSKYDYVCTFKDQRVLLKAINRVNRWTADFSRDYVPEIADKLGIDLSDIDCRSHAEYLRDPQFKPKSAVTESIIGEVDHPAQNDSQSIKSKVVTSFLKLIHLDY